MKGHQHLSTLALLYIAGCTTVVNSSDCTKAVVAGTDEPTFTERYSANIVLPMGEEEFLAVVRSLGLDYRTMGPNGEFPLSKPLHCRLDMTVVDRGYLISGGHDPKTGRTEAYIALVDRARRVIYIENRYMYPAVVR